MRSCMDLKALTVTTNYTSFAVLMLHTSFMTTLPADVYMRLNNSPAANSIAPSILACSVQQWGRG